MMVARKEGRKEGRSVNRRKPLSGGMVSELECLGGDGTGWTFFWCKV